jgi:hypothetical protein
MNVIRSGYVLVLVTTEQGTGTHLGYLLPGLEEKSVREAWCVCGDQADPCSHPFLELICFILTACSSSG